MESELAEGWIPVSELLQCLVECSEKASLIARIFRGEDDLFGLLVEEKAKIEKNRLVVQDFKTLADVLVQVTIKRDVGQKFPSLTSRIQGEEQDSFQNTLGERISVQLTDSPSETADLLRKVLHGRSVVAERLADAVHAQIKCGKQHSSATAAPLGTFGIWIDPIDSTAEYIQAKQNDSHEYGLDLYGLKCVCVLIGVYDLTTGTPVMGIINQPFYEENDSALKWESKIYWGISYNSEREVSSTVEEGAPERNEKVIVTSMFEKKQLQAIMELRYTVVHAAGAGYKCLAVARKMADLYVLTMPSTHYWDTCGPHAILAAKGGGIVDFNQIINAADFVDHSNLQDYQLKYLEDSTNLSYSNTGGMIAYRDANDLMEFLQLLKENGYRNT